ncbi:MAG: membrane protein insertase YidC [Alphaproteobacteria bacterium]
MPQPRHHHPHHPHAGGPELRNLVIAIVAATAILFGWEYFYQRPRTLAYEAAQQKAEEAAQAEKAKEATAPSAPKADAGETAAPRIPIDSARLQGSLPSVGNRIDDLTLRNYHETLDANSPAVKLLSPLPGADAYFAELGVLAAGNTAVPGATTRWQASGKSLGTDAPLSLSWTSPQGVTFSKSFTLDDNYMFTVTYKVANHGAAPVSVYPYGLISRNYQDVKKHYVFMHEGPLGVFDRILDDATYKELREKGDQKFSGAHGWIGMADKYWLTAIIPDAAQSFDSSFKYFKRQDSDAYQADYRGGEMTVAPGAEQGFTVHLFAGAKEVKLIDAYRTRLDIPLFDRAIDFGTLWFLTKPLFYILSYFHSLVGNFGIAIFLLTLCIKLVMFPLANKSFTSMAQMRLLTPKMNELKERHREDKLKMNQAVMELYKREKVNPMSGCLPMLVQIPVFIALYRVLFVTIEMRHAPFYGWIRDLSAPDPTTIFNLFGLIPWDPPSALHVGVLPLFMCGTMIVQQKLNPKPADEVQAMMISYMPYVFLAFFAGFPAGLVLYWICNNTLSILQQLLIGHRLKKKGLKVK